jgi:hypothetical protein
MDTERMSPMTAPANLFSGLNPKSDTLAASERRGREAAVADEDNPFLTQGWLTDTYGDEKTAKSLVVDQPTSRTLNSLIVTSAGKLNLGVSVQVKVSSNRADWKELNDERLTWVRTSDEGVEPKTYAYTYTDDEGKEYEYPSDAKVKIVWKAKDRRNRKSKTDASE